MRDQWSGTTQCCDNHPALDQPTGPARVWKGGQARPGEVAALPAWARSSWHYARPPRRPIRESCHLPDSCTAPCVAGVEHYWPALLCTASIGVPKKKGVTGHAWWPAGRAPCMPQHQQPAPPSTSPAAAFTAPHLYGRVQEGALGENTAVVDHHVHWGGACRQVGVRPWCRRGYGVKKKGQHASAAVCLYPHTRPASQPPPAHAPLTCVKLGQHLIHQITHTAWAEPGIVVLIAQPHGRENTCSS